MAFATRQVSPMPDAIAPDGSQVRLSRHRPRQHRHFHAAGRSGGQSHYASQRGGDSGTC